MLGRLTTSDTHAMCWGKSGRIPALSRNCRCELRSHEPGHPRIVGLDTFEAEDREPRNHPPPTLRSSKGRTVSGEDRREDVADDFRQAQVGARTYRGRGGGSFIRTRDSRYQRQEGAYRSGVHRPPAGRQRIDRRVLRIWLDLRRDSCAGRGGARPQGDQGRARFPRSAGTQRQGVQGSGHRSAWQDRDGGRGRGQELTQVRDRKPRQAHHGSPAAQREAGQGH